MAVQKLTSQACLELVRMLPLWQLDSEISSITRNFVFRDFVQAFDFMTQIAQRAEHHHHHPNWFNAYHKVTITWTTHDVSGLTENDILMAKFCDDTFNLFK
jgi:4a-hydroxytetrahydrobiopterin dehydratase